MSKRLPSGQPIVVKNGESFWMSLSLLASNREEALKLKLSPCSACDVGWADRNSDGTSKSCYDSCEYFKRYNKMICKSEKKF